MNSTYLNAYTKRTILILRRLTFRRSKLKLKPYDLKSNNIYRYYQTKNEIPLLLFILLNLILNSWLCTQLIFSR